MGPVVLTFIIYKLTSRFTIYWDGYKPQSLNLFVWLPDSPMLKRSELYESIYDLETMGFETTKIEH